MMWPSITEMWDEDPLPVPSVAVAPRRFIPPARLVKPEPVTTVGSAEIEALRVLRDRVVENRR